MIVSADRGPARTENMVVQRKFMAALAILIAGFTAVAVSARADESAFTSLDEIDRVRQAGCGINDFEEFLAWYSSATTGGGWLEQVVFTGYMVQVGKLADPAAPGYGVDRQQYLGQFRITSRDYRASREASSAPLPPEYRRITLFRVSDTQYRVSWQGGLPFAGVEGADRDLQAGAYIFEHKKDCWYLTGDLR